MPDTSRTSYVVSRPSPPAAGCRTAGKRAARAPHGAVPQSPRCRRGPAVTIAACLLFYPLFETSLPNGLKWMDCSTDDGRLEYTALVEIVL